MTSKTTNKLSPRCASERFGWCWITRTSIRRAGRRSCRSPEDRVLNAFIERVGPEGRGRRRQEGRGDVGYVGEAEGSRTREPRAAPGE